MPTPPEPDLSERVETLTVSVNSLRDAHDENTAAQQEATRVLRDKQSRADQALAATQRQQRATRRQGIAIVVLVALFLGWLWFDRRQSERDTVKAAVTNCLNTNVARRDRETRDEEIPAIVFDVLGSVVPPGTPDEKARRDVIIAQAIAAARQRLRDTLPPALQQRDCSEKAVTSPTVITTTTTGPPG